MIWFVKSMLLRAFLTISLNLKPIAELDCILHVVPQHKCLCSISRRVPWGKPLLLAMLQLTILFHGMMMSPTYLSLGSLLHEHVKL